MKAVLCICISSLVLFAQPKEAPKEPPKPLTDRPLTETEVLKARLDQANIELAQKAHDIEGYQKEVKPYMDEQQGIVTAACLSVGVPVEKIQTECGFNIGVGPDGKQISGPDGKPIASHVWKIEPQKAPEPKSDKK